MLTLDDTVKAPLPAPYLPGSLGTGVVPTSWNRDELFAAGALTLGELVAQYPGVTMMTTGYISAPEVLSWHGDQHGVRLFVDGVEREEVTPRNVGITDFTLIPLWSLEQVTLEATPGELRVHARTWRVDHTTPATRVDVLTGSENLNLFRGFFGQRSAKGLAIQLAAQQANTASVTGMDGDALGTMVRLGWASGPWSVDLTSLRQGLVRAPGIRNPRTTKPLKNALPAFDGSSSMTYLRAGWHDPQASGAWMQFVAATIAATKTHPKASTISAAAVADTADTTASHAQYSLSGGINRGGLRLSGSGRVRSANGKLEGAPAVRAEWIHNWLSVNAMAGRRFEGTGVWDARATAVPRDWLRLSASLGASQAGLDGGKATRAGSRVEGAVRWRDRWVSVGAVRLAGGVVSAPVELDTAMRAVRVPDGTAFTASFTGPLLRGWNASTDIIEWKSATTFRPQTQARTKVWFASSFKDKFPQGNFHLLAALTHEYRSQLFVTKGNDPLGQVTPGWSVFGTQLEIRIGTAVVSWTYRNMAGTNFETFPGYLMPRITSAYGIRWEFWN